MTRRWGVLFLLVLTMTSTRAASPTIAIDATSPAGKVSPLLYGLMTEEINHAYDGGLYAELVQNRAFLDDARVAGPLVGRPGRRNCREHRARPWRPAQPGDPHQSATGRDAGAPTVMPRALPTKATGASPSNRTPAIAPRFTRRPSPGFDGPITLSIESEDGADGLRQRQGYWCDAGLEAVRADLTTGSVRPRRRRATP